MLSDKAWLKLAKERSVVVRSDGLARPGAHGIHKRVLFTSKRPRFSKTSYDYKHKVGQRYILVDVTSGAPEKNRVFSPLFGGKDSVERTWQGCKRYCKFEICADKEANFWRKYDATADATKKTPRRSAPVAKFKALNKRPPTEMAWVGKGTVWHNKPDARRHIYTPAYLDNVLNRRASKRLQDILLVYKTCPGHVDLVVIDYDGPRAVQDDGTVTNVVREVDEAAVHAAVEGTNSFGHGWVVAAALAGVREVFGYKMPVV
jgi:hypothetical protein